MEIKAVNVNDAFDKGVSLLSSLWVRKVAPRGAPTREATEPVITHYARPTERVLFSPVRDANPFLHFFESLWLLAGRADVAFLSLFSSRMAEFSDDGHNLNGAYGWRWRNEFDYDQLKEVVSLLCHDPDSRRAVMTMWAPWDLEATKKSKDIPCNTQVYVKIRDGRLDLTVTCRSNDMLWGAYGTNVVQFSMLQEYLAGKLGIAVGRYTQMSDSFHVYLPPHPGGEVWERVLRDHVRGKDPYSHEVKAFPICAGHPRWDSDMECFFADADAFLAGGSRYKLKYKLGNFSTMFWDDVVKPMWYAWHTRDSSHLTACAATDWRLAGTEWLERHTQRKEPK